MDNQRIFIWAALALVLWLNYTTWERDYAPPPAPAAATKTEAGAPAPSPSAESLPSLPSSQQSAAPAAPASSVPATAPVEKAATIRVVTDVLDLEISTRGGELQRADLLK